MPSLIDFMISHHSHPSHIAKVSEPIAGHVCRRHTTCVCVGIPGMSAIAIMISGHALTQTHNSMHRATPY